jgi:hypothetical protein
MVAIDVVETSGVDHPAHLTEGWVVMKAATPEVVEGLFGSLNTMKGTNVPETKTGATETEKAAAPSVEDLQKQIADLKAQLADKGKGNPFGKAAEEQTAEELLKNADLPQPVRDMLEKSARETEALRKQAAEDREAFAKERDARLDADAITEAKATYKSLAINHGEVAPALRRVAMVSPDVAKSIETALKAADAQLAESGLFTEVGTVAKAASAAGAYQEIVAKGEELRKSDSSLTAEAAFAKALAADPELYTRYLEESQKGA